jgi:hypothetical protein
MRWVEPSSLGSSQSMISSRAWRAKLRCSICEAQLTPPVGSSNRHFQMRATSHWESDRRRGRRACMRHASHPLDRCPGLDPQMTRKVTVLVTAGRCRPTKEEFEGIAKNRIQMDTEVKTCTLRGERGGRGHGTTSIPDRCMRTGLLLSDVTDFRARGEHVGTVNHNLGSLAVLTLAGISSLASVFSDPFSVTPVKVKSKEKKSDSGQRGAPAGSGGDLRGSRRRGLPRWSVQTLSYRPKWDWRCQGNLGLVELAVNILARHDGVSVSPPCNTSTLLKKNVETLKQPTFCSHPAPENFFGQASTSNKVRAVRRWTASRPCLRLRKNHTTSSRSIFACDRPPKAPRAASASSPSKSPSQNRQPPATSRSTPQTTDAVPSSASPSPKSLRRKPPSSMSSTAPTWPASSRVCSLPTAVMVPTRCWQP